MELSPRVQAVVGSALRRLRRGLPQQPHGDRLSSDDNLFSPRVGLIYKPVGAGVALHELQRCRTCRARASSSSSLSLTNQALEPGGVHATTRSAPSGTSRPALAFTAAVYRLDRSNVVVPIRLDPTRLDAGGRPAHEGRRAGRSAATSTAAWSIVGGYAYQDGEITRSLSATALAGAQLAQLPKHIVLALEPGRLLPRVGGGPRRRSTGATMFTSTDNTVSSRRSRASTPPCSSTSPRSCGRSSTSRTCSTTTTTRRAQQQQHHARLAACRALRHHLALLAATRGVRPRRGSRPWRAARAPRPPRARRS